MHVTGRYAANIIHEAIYKPFSGRLLWPSLDTIVICSVRLQFQWLRDGIAALLELNWINVHLI